MRVTTFTVPLTTSARRTLSANYCVYDQTDDEVLALFLHGICAEDFADLVQRETGHNIVVEKVNS